MAVVVVGANWEAARAGLHMGEEELCGTNTVFRWNSADLSGASRPGDALPCAQTPLCAHGSASAHPDGNSKTAESRGRLAFVPASPSSPMCNPLLRPGQRTHCRRRHPAPTTSTARPSRLGAGRLDDQPWDATSDHPAHALRRPAALTPWGTARLRGSTTTRAGRRGTPGRAGQPPPEAQQRPAATRPPASQRLGPISARNSTDLGGETIS